jgi:4,5-DOPA dioxygenase extradiol
MDNRMPALFIGHGSPMNAVEENEFNRNWRETALQIPRPKAVLCISAHWETPGVRVTASDRPETIYDFYGFPEKLFEVRYPAPGDRLLASRTAELAPDAEVGLDSRRGLDHGCWSVLTAMYPGADVPVVQLSLATEQPGPFHYHLAKELASLREQGVLILGSGNIVHNLRRMEWDRPDGFEWASRFNERVKQRIEAGEHEELIDYRALGPEAQMAVSTPEHYLPLLYALALQEKGEKARFFNDKLMAGSISMTCVTIGA